VGISPKEKNLKEEVMQIIPKKLQFNLLHLLSDICLDMKEPLDFDENGELNKIFDKVKNLTSEVYDIILLPSDKRSDFLKKVEEARKDILDLKKYIYTLIELLKTVTVRVMDETNLKKFSKGKDFKNINFDFSKIKKDCLDFIFWEDDEEFYDIEVFRKEAFILSCLPLKMTREKYNDYLRAFFENLFGGIRKSIAEERIEFLKYSFAPFKEEFLGKKFSYISDGLMEFWKMDLSEQPYEKFKEYIEILENKKDNILKIKDFISSLYNDINYITNLVLFCFDEEYLFEDNIMFKDLYFSTRELISSKDNEVFNETILDRVYDCIEDLEKEINVMYSKIVRILDMSEDEEFSEETEKYIEVMFCIDVNFKKAFSFDFVDFNEVFDFDEGEEAADEVFLNKKADEFIEFIKDTLSEFKNKKAKEIKSNFFRKTLYPFDEKEFENYIDFIFKGFDNNESDLLYIIKINRLLVEEGFITEEDIEEDIDWEVEI